MIRVLKKTLKKTALLFVTALFFAAPVLAGKADGKVEWRQSSTPQKTVTIRQGNQTTIIRTSPEMAEHIRRAVRNGRVVVRVPGHGYSYYSDQYYPYYRDKKPAYSAGYALGRKLSD